MYTAAKLRGQSSRRRCGNGAMPGDHGRIATICTRDNTAIKKDPGEFMVDQTEKAFVSAQPQTHPGNDGKVRGHNNWNWSALVEILRQFRQGTPNAESKNKIKF